jgi:hypothetical protein
VNDYLAGRLPLATYSGRAPGGRDVGAAGTAYSAVLFPATTIDAVRVVWNAGTVAPKVAEVVPSD